MREVHVGPLNVTKRTAVVGSIASADALDISVEDAQRKCDIVEIRLDQMIERGEGWIKKCRVLHDRGIPLLLTLRHESEHGNWAGSNRQRLAILKRAQPMIALVDVEIEQDAVPGAVRLLSDLVIIGSFHDFAATPEDDRLDAIVQRGHVEGAHIVKLATWVEDDRTLARLESLILRHPTIPLAVVGMGPMGPESRLRLPRVGSCLTYGYLDVEIAPGQVSAGELKAKLAMDVG